MPYKFDDPAPFRYRNGDLLLGLDGQGQEIGISTERHAITIGGSRTGKGAGLLVPNARRWPHNLLVIDPKGENAALSWEARAAKGQEVYILDPYEVADVPDELRASFNPLDDIDPDAMAAHEDLETIADGLVRRFNRDHARWDNGTVDLLAGMMAYVITTSQPAGRSLPALRDILTQSADDLYETAQKMLDHAAFGGMARTAGLTIMRGLETDKSMEASYLSDAREHTKWINSPPMRALLAESTFSLSEIKTGSASVYLVLPPDLIKTRAGFLRLFVRCGIKAMAAGGSGKGKRCLFMLDEFFSLGRIDEIAEAAGLMPSYGVHLWPFLQDLGQLQGLYGQTGSETFFGNSDAWTFLGNSDPLTLRYISDTIGELTPAEIMPEPPEIDFSKVEFQKDKPFQASGGFWWTEPTQKDLQYHYARQETRRSEHQTEQDNRRRAHEAEQENRRRAVDTENARRRAEYEHAMKQAGRPRLPPDRIADIIGKGGEDVVANSLIAILPRRKVLNLKVAAYFHQSDPYSGYGRNLVEERRVRRDALLAKRRAERDAHEKWQREIKAREVESDRREKERQEYRATVMHAWPSAEQSFVRLANLYEPDAPIDHAYATTVFPRIVSAINLDKLSKKISFDWSQPDRDRWEPVIAEFLDGRPLAYFSRDTLPPFLELWGHDGAGRAPMWAVSPPAGSFPIPDLREDDARMYYTAHDSKGGGPYRVPTVGGIRGKWGNHWYDDAANAVSITFAISEARALDDGPAFIQPVHVTVGPQCRTLLVLEYQGALYTFAAWVEDGEISANWKMTRGGDAAYLSRVVTDDLALRVAVADNEADKERLLYEIAHSRGFKRYNYNPDRVIERIEPW